MDILNISGTGALSSSDNLCTYMVLSLTTVDWVLLKFLSIRLAKTLCLCLEWRLRISKSWFFNCNVIIRAYCCGLSVLPNPLVPLVVSGRFSVSSMYGVEATSNIICKMLSPNLI